MYFSVSISEYYRYYCLSLLIVDNLFIEKLNNLLSRVSLIDILRDRYKVVPRGGNKYTVQCPFHKDGQETNPSMSVDDDKGVSLLLVNENRDSFVDVLDDIIKQEINVSAAKQYNGGFSEKTKPHPKRTLFFSMLGNGDLLSTINETLKIPLVIRLKRKVGYIYRKMIKK